MKRYDEAEPFTNIKWTNYVIIVPTEEDRQELMAAFEHFHYSDIDTEYVVVNQLAHEYLDSERTGNEKTYNNIVVNPELYELSKVKR